MTSLQQHRFVAVSSILILAVYFPAAGVLQRAYVPDMAPPPAGAVRQIFNLEKVSKDGIGFVERIQGYGSVPDLKIYEDDRPLVPARGISDVDRLPGRFAEETGFGIVLSPTDGSNVKFNRYRYWIVRPDPPR